MICSVIAFSVVVEYRVSTVGVLGTSCDWCRCGGIFTLNNFLNNV